jgi:hypothetical protein
MTASGEREKTECRLRDFHALFSANAAGLIKDFMGGTAACHND